MKITSALVLMVCVTAGSSSLVQAAQETRKFASKEAMCVYLEKQKEAAEDVMKKGYSASQYDRLESKRKYWKKQYVEKCL